MSDAQKEKPLTEQQIQARFDAALKGALKTPHKPLKPVKAPVTKPKPEKKPGS